MELQHPWRHDVDAAVSEIHYVNHLWHFSQRIFPKDSPLCRSLRDVKGRLQIDLIEQHPDATRLVPATDSEDESLSIHVLAPGVRHRDAAHIPSRLAARALTPRGLAHLLPAAEE